MFDVPTPTQQSEQSPGEPASGAAFQAALRESTRRVLVTPMLAAVCVLVFLAMTLSGVSPLEPSIEALSLGCELRAFRGRGPRVLASFHLDVSPRWAVAPGVQHVVSSVGRPDD